jgi:hypothetical protein
VKKKTAGQSASEKSGKMEKAARKNVKDGSTVESLLPTGSRERAAVGIAAAAGGLLLASATLGVGPAALAGAAGYLAYRGMSRKRKTTRPVSLPISIDKRKRSGAREAPNGYQQTQ